MCRKSGTHKVLSEFSFSVYNVLYAGDEAVRVSPAMATRSEEYLAKPGNVIFTPCFGVPMCVSQEQHVQGSV